MSTVPPEPPSGTIPCPPPSNDTVPIPRGQASAVIAAALADLHRQLNLLEGLAMACARGLDET